LGFIDGANIMVTVPKRAPSPLAFILAFSILHPYHAHK
jgi:hypothetical protein